MGACHGDSTRKPEAAGRNNPQPYCDFWKACSSEAAVIFSRSRLVRPVSRTAHSLARGVFPWRGPQSDTHITIAIRGNESTCHAAGDRHRNRYLSRRARSGSLHPVAGRFDRFRWGPCRNSCICIFRSSHFSSSNLGYRHRCIRVGALRYETALEDPLLAEIGCASRLGAEDRNLRRQSACRIARQQLSPQGWCKSMPAHRLPGLIRFLKQKGSTGAGFFVCWTTSKQTSKAISASIAWHRLRA